MTTFPPSVRCIIFEMENSGSILSSLPPTTDCAMEPMQSMLPLEIQELIILLGSQHTASRLDFLLLCALVCRSWLPTSRSLLQLKVNAVVPRRNESLIALAHDPKTTLIHGIGTIILDGMQHGTIAAVVLLPSVHSLYFVSDLNPGPYTDVIVSVPSVSSVTIRNLHATSSLSFVIAKFPCIKRLKLNGRLYYPSLPVPDRPKIDQTGITSLGMTIWRAEDVDVLVGIFNISSSLRKIQLRLRSHDIVPAVENWLSQSVVQARRDIVFSLKIVGEPLLKYVPCMFSCASSVHRPDTVTRFLH